MRMILKIVSGPFGELESADITRFIYQLKPGESLRVGRSRFKADMAINADQRMSSGHFSVNCENEGCYLTDMQSTNGTFVNGQRITEVTRLRDGDDIVAGTTRFTVDISEPTRSNSSLEIDRVALDHYATSPVDGNTSPPEVKPPQFSLEILSGPGRSLESEGTETVSQLWLKPETPLKVGSWPKGADMVISGDLDISPVHFTIEQQGANCTLEVCDDCTTVRVNNIGMRQGELSGGERILVGQTTLLLRAIEQYKTPPTQVPPKQVAAAEPPSEAELTAHSNALSSGVRGQILASLQWFQAAAPLDEFRDKVCQKLAAFTRSPDLDLRQTAAICFARWTSVKGQPTLLQFLGSSDPVVLEAAIEGLIQIGDLRNVDPLAQVLKDSARRDMACHAIVSQGGEGEKLGTRLLLHEELQAQLAACQILAEVGGKQSELALQAKLQRSTGADQEAIREAAQQALHAIRERV